MAVAVLYFPPRGPAPPPRTRAHAHRRMPTVSVPRLRSPLAPTVAGASIGLVARHTPDPLQRSVRAAGAACSHRSVARGVVPMCAACVPCPRHRLTRRSAGASDAVSPHAHAARGWLQDMCAACATESRHSVISMVGLIVG
eukprot:5948068-Prymnesium_polylepis.1